MNLQSKQRRSLNPRCIVGGYRHGMILLLIIICSGCLIVPSLSDVSKEEDDVVVSTATTATSTPEEDSKTCLATNDTCTETRNDDRADSSTTSTASSTTTSTSSTSNSSSSSSSSSKEPMMNPKQPDPNRETVESVETVEEKSDEKCHVSPNVCKVAKTSQLYQRGTGTALAYKPKQPIRKLIYGETPIYHLPPETIDIYHPETIQVVENVAFTQQIYSVSSFPFERVDYYRTEQIPPYILIYINVFTCQSTSSIESTTTTTTQCCCKPFRGQSTDDIVGTVHIWQAFPNGTYPSLRPGVEDGVCRGKQHLTDTNQVSFYTQAPGSTGLLNGLRSDGFDLPPYGPPVIHIMVTPAANFRSSIDSLIVDVPILLNDYTSVLDQANFTGPDLRGPAILGRNKGPLNRTKPEFYKINSWIGTTYPNQGPFLTIDMDVYLQPLQQNSRQSGSNKEYNNKDNTDATSTATTTTTTTKTPQDVKQKTQTKSTKTRRHRLCPMKGLRGFFLQPLTICTPYLLDLFNL